jgi:hypothetical protein
MPDPLNVPFSELEQQVLDCLTHLYDFMFLQDHPLVEELVQEVKGTNRNQEFRAQSVSPLQPSAIALHPPTDGSASHCQSIAE